MNKRMVVFLAAIIVTAIGLELYSYINVSGTQIVGASEISTAAVTVEKTDTADPANNQTWTLDDGQKANLQKMVLASGFKRTGKTELKNVSGQQYIIKADFGTSAAPLIITSFGSEYALVADQFGGKYLSILNYNWQKQLESIITNTPLK
jgi:hypothetical protein